MKKTHRTKKMNTVYVSNLPVETHEEELVKIFSDVGPLKKCFIVERKREFLNFFAFGPWLWLDWLALHLKFGSVYFQQFGGISRPHVDQLQI